MKGEAPLYSFSNFTQNMDWSGLIDLLMQVAAVLLCLTIHETCHGLAAYALGDPTAKRMHRLSLNPLRHIDPFGALMMLAVGFGWAKPVPVDMRYFKHPKSGMALTALAGPASNFLLAYAAMLLYALFYGLLYAGAVSGTLSVGLLDFCWLLASLSVGLWVFNLITFPPLDGSKVLEGVLPDRIYYQILRFERIGIVVLMAVLWTGVLDGPLYAVRRWILELLLHGSEWVFRLFV